MQRTNSQQEFHDDGTPRRKYESEETQEVRYAFLGSLGLAVASALALAKNVMFGSARSDAAGEQARDAGSVAAAVPDRMSNFHSDSESGSPQGSSDDMSAAGQGDAEGLVTSSGFRSALANGHLGGVNDDSTPGSAIPASRAGAMELNDNVPLYGPMSSTWMAVAAGTPNAPPSSSYSAASIASMDSVSISIAPPAPSTGRPAESPNTFPSQTGSSTPATNGGGSDTVSNPGSASPPDLPPPSSGQPRAANRSPFLTGPLILGSLLMNNSVILSLSDFLKNAFDPDGDSLHVSGLTASAGELTPGHDGSWHFVPTAGDTSEVTFTYAVSDGLAQFQQLAVLDLVPPVGPEEPPAEQNPATVGTPYDDVIVMSGADDLVLGREGDEVIYGGDGNDRLLGGEGNDLIHGGAGDDVIIAGSGNDTTFGGEGNDVVFGDDGADRLSGDAGNDTVSGGTGDDQIYGEDGSDFLLGDDGDDLLDGGSGADRLTGGGGDDVHYGGAGSDVIEGGIGEDIAFGDDGDDVIAGEDGFDHLSGGSGDDTVSGGAGNDHLTGDEGADSLSGDDGDDIVLGAAGADTLDGGAGADIIIGGAGDDVADGGTGADLFIALTGDGNDAIDGGEGIDTYDAASTILAVTIDLAAGTVVGEEIGSDTIVRVENATGGQGDDTLVASEAVNVLAGGLGNDVFVFHSSLDAGNGRGRRDKILDFDVGDRLDLDDIVDEINGLTNSGSNGGDGELARMELISHAAEFTQPGQLRLRYDEFEGAPKATVLDGNIDFDAETEFQIEFTGELEELEMILAMHYFSTIRSQSDAG